MNVPHTTNRELFATNAACSVEEQKALADELSDPELRTLVQTVLDSMTPYTATGLLLTDDKAPVELLGMHAIDTLIQDELETYQKLFQEEGLTGLLEQPP